MAVSGGVAAAQEVRHLTAMTGGPLTQLLVENLKMDKDKVEHARLRARTHAHAHMRKHRARSAT